MSEIWLGVGIAGALLALAFTWLDDLQLPEPLKLMFHYAGLVALPGLLILGLPVLFLAQWVNLDVRMQQALCAGVIVATGWLTTAVFAELDRWRNRTEKTRDYHRALYAEIGNSLQSFMQNEAASKETLARIREDDRYVPLIPRQRHDFVFDELVKNIEVLPRQTIDIIVAYYAVMRAVTNLAEDMRSDAFKASAATRISMYEDYLELRETAFKYGQFALKLMTVYASQGADAADKLIQQAGEGINSLGEAQSDRSQGSA